MNRTLRLSQGAGVMSELVKFLCTGEHPLEANPRQKTREAMKEYLANGYVHVKFTDTRGGTELGFHVDRDRSDLRGLENDERIGEIRLVGDLTLDYVPVTCIARIDLASLQGEGHLEQRQK
jgi:hypothetical protein